MLFSQLSFNLNSFCIIHEKPISFFNSPKLHRWIGLNTNFGLKWQWKVSRKKICSFYSLLVIFTDIKCLQLFLLAREILKKAYLWRSNFLKIDVKGKSYSKSKIKNTSALSILLHYHSWVIHGDLYRWRGNSLPIFLFQKLKEILTRYSRTILTASKN